MTEEFQDPADHTERVDDVLKRAVALSDELQSTIAELTQMLRSDPEGETSARRASDPTN